MLLYLLVKPSNVTKQLATDKPNSNLAHGNYCRVAASESAGEMINHASSNG